MNLVWEPGKDKQGYVVCISISCDNGEITSTKSNVEIIFSKYHYHYGMVKCHQIVNFEEMGTEWSTGKNYGFWILWGIFKEYIKQSIIMAVLRKANSHSVVIFRLTKKKKKKINTVKDDPRRKTDSNFFLKLPSAYEILMRRNVM